MEEEGGVRLAGDSPVLAIEALWDDADMIEVRVTVATGGFRGRTQVYVALGELEDLANKLQGFPRSVEHRVDVSWGGEATENGLVTLAFCCTNAAGHAVLDAHLVSSGMGQDPPGQRIRLVAPVAPSRIDEFVPLLRAMERTKRGAAAL